MTKGGKATGDLKTLAQIKGATSRAAHGMKSPLP
jgi:hypothetical protein